MKDFLDPKEVISILQGFNLWWTGKPVGAPPFRRLAFDACKGFLDMKELRRAVLLSGPRRVGKTVILQQLAAMLISEKGSAAKSVLYLSLDHPILKLLNLREILRLYHEQIHPEGEGCYLLLDEVHHSPGWETEIKLLVDHHPNYRIVSTGSASVVQRNQLAESGVGRWLTIPVPTLSFYEFVHIRNEVTPNIAEDLRPSDLFSAKESKFVEIAAALRPLLPLFQRYLLVGGFPETARLDDLGLCQRLLREDVVERVLKRDMTSLFGVRNIDDLERLFIYLCIHPGGILAHNTIAKELEIGKVTVSNHLDLLEQANLVYCLPPLRLGGKQVLKGRNKYYLVDAALRNAVLLKGEEVLSDPDQMGGIVETTVLRHLYAYYYGDIPEIAYWRDSQRGKEVDIIVKSPKYHLPFEVKYREGAQLDRSSGLAIYSESEKLRHAYLVTKSDRDFGTTTPEGIETEFLKIPAHILCYLLGQAERLLWQKKKPGDSQPVG